METLRMKVRFKKLTADAVIPVKAHATDAGFDLVATSAAFDKDNGSLRYGTGIAVEIPDGHVGLLFPRSSVFKYDVTLSNCVGVIDSGYRGEIAFHFKGAHTFERRPSWAERLAMRLGYVKKFHNAPRFYKVGDRIGQLVIMPYPEVEWDEAEELSPSDRAEGGFGSTGK